MAQHLHEDPIIPSTSTPTPSPLRMTLPRGSSPPVPHSPAASQPASPGLALTPPTSSVGSSYAKSQRSFNTGSTQRSHQEYLDSLQPPSKEEFARLAKVQEEREKDHRHRDHLLQRQNRINAHRSMEAQSSLDQANPVEDSQRRSSIFGHRHSTSRSLSHFKSHSRNTSTSTAGAGREGDGDIMKSKAATLIQKHYRGYRVRREMQGLGLNASTRWTHAIRDAQWQEVTKPRPRAETMSSSGSGVAEIDGRPGTSRSAARQNWMKVATIARRAGADEDSSRSRSSSQSPSDEDFETLTPEQKKQRLKEKEGRRKHAMVMGLQYFLEMVDRKHRYGSNLRAYHEEWKKSDTNENFFYWLDYGEGRNLDLTMCPRERLDREQVRYLNREERQYYVVKVDQEGRLVWAKNGVRVDTTEAWKDSIYGVVPADDPTPAFAPDIQTHVQSKPSPDAQPEPHDHPGSDSHSASSRESKLEAAMAAKYANTGFDEAKGVKKINHVSAAIIFNKLLRKSVRKNTWIFVADTSFRLYVGIKTSGAFQHSSFLHGSRISAAGLIKIKNGRLTSLSPLSGHYRPPASNFRAFVHSLEEEGVDMSHVSISKSYAVLVGLETYIKTKKKGKEIVQRLSHRKMKILDPEEAAKKEEALKDKSESAAREREVLEKQREEEEHARPSVRFMKRLGIRSRTSEEQKVHTNGGSSGHTLNDA